MTAPTIVDFYTANIKKVHSYNADYISTIAFSPLASSDYQTFFDKEEITTKQPKFDEFHHRVTRVVRDGESSFVAFDDKLLELFGLLEEQKQRDIYKAVSPFVNKIQAQNAKLIEYSKIHHLSFWERIKFLFTNKISGLIP